MSYKKIYISYSHRSLIAISILFILIYFISTFLAGRLFHCSFNEFSLFNKTATLLPILKMGFEAIIFLSGMVILMFIPGIILVPLLCTRKIEFLDFLTYSAVANILLLIIGGTIFKAIFVNGMLNRFNFIMIIMGITIIVALFLAFRFYKREWRDTIVIKLNLAKIIIFCLIILLCLIIGHGYSNGTPFKIDLSEEHVMNIALGSQGDSLELLGVVNSLRTHIYPYWDLEYSSRMGYHVINPPLCYFFFLHCELLFGHSYVAYGSIFLLSMIVLVAISFHISQLYIHEQNNFYIIIFPLSFFFIWFLSCVSKNLLINSWHLLSFIFLTLHYYFLILQKYRHVLIFACISFMMFYESLFFVCVGLLLFPLIIMTGEWQDIKDLLRKYACFIFLYLSLIGIMGFLNGCMFIYAKTLLIEKFARFDYFNLITKIYPEQKNLWPSYDIAQVWVLIRWLAQSTMLFVITLVLPKKDSISRYLSWIGVIYFFVIIAATYRRPHYIIPLAIMTFLIAPRYLYTVYAAVKRRFLKHDARIYSPL